MGFVDNDLNLRRGPRATGATMWKPNTAIPSLSAADAKALLAGPAEAQGRLNDHGWLAWVASSADGHACPSCSRGCTWAGQGLKWPKNPYEFEDGTKTMVPVCPNGKYCTALGYAYIAANAASPSMIYGN